MNFVAAGASTIALLAVAGSAAATITLSAGSFGGTGVHSTAGLSNGTVTGLAGTDPVTLSTIGDLLDTKGGGESAYKAHDGLMDDFSITFTNNYDAVTFNLNIPNGRPTTDFTLSVNGGPFSFSETGLGKGENKFQLSATGADFIHSLVFKFTGADVQDVRQIRVGNRHIDEAPTAATSVPEPATWAMMVMGFVGLGALLRRRRARASLA